MGHNEQEERGRVLANRIAIGALAIGVIMLMCTNPLADWTKNSFFINYYSSTVITLIGFGLAFLIWKEIEGISKGDFADKLTTAITKRYAVSGFQLIDKKTAYRMAADEVRHATVIKIIGYSQSVNKGLGEENHVDRYLKNTVARIKNNPNVKYQRISSCNLSDIFENHLKECLNSIDHNTQQFQLSLLSDFRPTHTSLLMKDEDGNGVYMLILNQHVDSIHVPCLITREPYIIQQLDSHFNSLWTEYSNRYAVIDKIEDFDVIINKAKEITPLLNAISSSYFTAQKLWHAIDYLRKCFSELESNLKLVIHNEISIDHSNSTSSLLMAFSMYMNKMQVGDEYFAITTIGVWRKVTHEDMREGAFKKAHKRVMEKKIKMNRILILDFNIIPDPIKNNFIDESIASAYDKFHLVVRIIKQHIDYLQKNPNYDFKIFFIKNYKNTIGDYTNFTLIKYKNEGQVLFSPKRDNDEHITKTIINFESEDVNERGKEFLDLIDLIMSQSLVQDHINFLKGLAPEYFSDSNNLIKILGGKASLYI